MNKTKSFIAIILLFSVLFCFPISKISAAPGHYILVVDRAGYTQTITTPWYSTSVVTKGEWLLVPAYTTTIAGWTELAISKFHINMGSFGVLWTTSYIHHPITNVWHPSSTVWVSYPATSKQIWHPALGEYVWHPAVMHQVWLAAVH